MCKFKEFFFLLFLGASTVLTAQEKDLLDWFDSQLGIENLGLYNGPEFLNVYTVEDNAHQFFKTKDFRLGSVTYDGEIYTNVRLVYDIYEDQLIIRVQNQNGTTNQFLLLKEKVRRFSIDDRYFVNIIDPGEARDKSSGFYEILVLNNIVKLYKKHRKKVSKVLRNSSVSYKFFEQKPEYFISIDRGIYPIKTRKDLMALFPDYKKELSNYKWTSKNFNYNDTQLMAAINQLEQLLSQ